MDSEGSVGTSLTELRRTVEGLDPKANSSLLGGSPGGFLNKIFGRGVTGYFDKYRSSRRISPRSSRAWPATRTSC